MKHNLRLANADEPDAKAIYRARIDQSHREYRSPSGDITNTHGWQVIETGATNPVAGR